MQNLMLSLILFPLRLVSAAMCAHKCSLMVSAYTPRMITSSAEACLPCLALHDRHLACLQPHCAVLPADHYLEKFASKCAGCAQYLIEGGWAGEF